MPEYDFTLVMGGPIELTDDLADKLFAAGCDDATSSSSNGIVTVDIRREAGDLESAIRSANANLSAVKMVVRQVGIGPF